MATTIPRIPEAEWAKVLSGLGYVPAGSPAVDFETSDGSVVVELLERRRASVRDLHAALAKLAIHLASRDHIKLACLLLVVGRMTPQRLRREWQDVLSTLRPQIAERLGLVALGTGFRMCVPERSPPLIELSEVGQRLQRTATRRKLPGMPKPLVVLKVLLCRWLLGAGPISRRELGEQTGCSYPTVAKAIDRFGRCVRRHTNGSVEFGEFPQEAWTELLALVPSQRARLSYVDRSGRSPDVEGLLRRLQKLRPASCALGGVIAAQHWDPHFDLRGLPRVDVSLDASSGLDPGFVRELDPALRELSGEIEAPVLVLHPLDRPTSLFTPSPAGVLRMADPVETLLDLSEMRLVEQANALIAHLERERAGGPA